MAQAPGMVFALNLNDPSPEFLKLLDSDATAAVEGFCRFIEHLFQVSPPRIFSRVPADDREDVFQEIVLHCIDNGCKKLRLYQPRAGSTFAGWLTTVASRKIADWLKRQMPNPRENETEPVAPEPKPDELAERKERESIFFALFRKLGHECRRLLRLRCWGFTNREITKLLGRPPSDNKIIGTQVSDCRKRFLKVLRESGYDVSDFVDTVGT